VARAAKAKPAFWRKTLESCDLEIVTASRLAISSARRASVQLGRSATGVAQTGGEIVFEVDPNGVAGFLETALIFEPSHAIHISDRTLVFDFLNSANANQFIADGLFNFNTFFQLSEGGSFCAELNCGTALQDIAKRTTFPA
jgi:hypothetical protein